ncbi:MAG: MerR family transcriptional regulator [Clostridiales bacterium]|nr:MerR family transcriptional regulator [Clostridiales bacterium]
MNIHEAAKITGLSPKAIRLYESRGVLQVQKIANDYRDYQETELDQLRRIKLFRLAGISISDIKLLNDGIITTDEMVAKRKKELEMAYGHHSEQWEFCDSLIQRLRNKQYNDEHNLDETDEIEKLQYGPLAAGIDLGTTTISATVIDLDARRQIEYYSVPNCFRLAAQNAAFSEQDADGIVKKASELINHILSTYSGICVIGVTGQAHGILYTDEKGDALSPLITWQDKRGDSPAADGRSYCEQLIALTGDRRLATGYGTVTHYYNALNGLVPEGAVSFCSIMDYLIMTITGQARPLCHMSIAASFGLFDLQQNRFRRELMALIPGAAALSPAVTDDFALCGTYKGIPVAVAIGDNQASFLGSVKNLEKSILINIGTGSQISLMSDLCGAGAHTELRPLVKGRYLTCGAALCGGSAYALIERFFQSYAAHLDGAKVSQYQMMNSLARQAYLKGRSPLQVDTSFCGTRQDPQRRGAIAGIDEQNFTPENLILGVIQGMCKELHGLFLDAQSHNKCEIVASGGAVQRIEILKDVIRDDFGMPVFLNQNREEAAVGAALFAAVAAGALHGIEDFAGFIHYQPERD